MVVNATQRGLPFLINSWLIKSILLIDVIFELIDVTLIFVCSDHRRNQQGKINV